MFVCILFLPITWTFCLGYPWTNSYAVPHAAGGNEKERCRERLLFIERAVERTAMLNALLFIEPPSRSIRRAMDQEKKLSPELQRRAEKALEARNRAFIMDWFTIRDMPGAEEDAKLLGMAGEVAREVGREKK
jgi:hypothetical protein